MAREDVVDWVRESGRVVREKLACGHWLDVTRLAPGKMWRNCTHEACVGAQHDGRVRLKLVQDIGGAVRRIERKLSRARRAV